MKNNFLKLVSTGFLFCSLNAVSYADCSYYNHRDIAAVNATSIGFINGYLYSEVETTVGISGTFNLALVSITPEQWEQVKTGHQVILTGTKTCHCTIEGQTYPFTEGDWVDPFFLSSHKKGPVRCY